MSRLRKLYTDELSSLERGLPLFHPQLPLTNGQTQRRLEIGDVGHIEPVHGYFRRYFSVHLEPNQEGQPSVDHLPLGFSPMVKPEIDSVFINAPIFASDTIQASNMRHGTSDPFFGGSVRFSSPIKCGAILATPDPIECINAREDKGYQEYFRAHKDAWTQFFQTLGIKLSDVILITGLDRTTSWANAVFKDVEFGSGFGLEVQFAPGEAGGVGLACGYSWINPSSAYTNYASHSSNTQAYVRVNEESRIELDHDVARPAPESSSGEYQPLNPNLDQTLFIRHCRFRSRMNSLKKKRAIEGDSEEGYETPTEVTGLCEFELVPEREGFTDHLDPILNYILEHSDADFAMAHDTDLEFFSTSDSSPGLSITVDGGIGTIRRA